MFPLVSKDSSCNLGSTWQNMFTLPCPWLLCFWAPLLLEGSFGKCPPIPPWRSASQRLEFFSGRQGPSATPLKSVSCPCELLVAAKAPA